ncbi:17454_t:CDS:1, partial [Entrophospora sp. SA101]
NSEDTRQTVAMVQDASCEIDRRHQNHIPACEELVVTHGIVEIMWFYGNLLH